MNHDGEHSCSALREEAGSEAMGGSPNRPPSYVDATRDRRRQFEERALIHLDWLRRAALRLSHNRVEAEDLVQETCLRAFTHFDRFYWGTNCQAWLLTILRNTFMDRMRRLEREVLGLAQLEVGLDRDGSHGVRRATPERGPLAATPEEEFFKRVAAREFLTALARLPKKYREVILLADLAGHSYKEIAQTSGVPMGTVMSRLFRGRRRLRAVLRLVQRDAVGRFSRHGKRTGVVAPPSRAALV